MCFFDQQIYQCGCFKWGPFRQHCAKEHRTGETCGMKLVMQNVFADAKCRICQKLKVKYSLKAKEEERVRRWKREGCKRWNASVEASERSIEGLIKDIDRLEVKRGERQKKLDGSTDTLFTKLQLDNRGGIPERGLDMKSFEAQIQTQTDQPQIEGKDKSEDREKTRILGGDVSTPRAEEIVDLHQPRPNYNSFRFLSGNVSHTEIPNSYGILRNIGKIGGGILATYQELLTEKLVYDKQGDSQNDNQHDPTDNVEDLSDINLSRECTNSKYESHILTKPFPPDSGYHSGLGTDTESTCLTGSVGSSLGLSQDFLQKFITFFGDTLIDRAGARAWAEYALAEHTAEFVEQRLNILLKDYAAAVLSIAENRETEVQEQAPAPVRMSINRAQTAKSAIKLISRHRSKIACYFRCNALSAQMDTQSMAARLQDLGKQLSLTEKLGLFDKLAAVIECTDEDLDDLLLEEENEDELNEAAFLANLGHTRDFLFLGEPFQHLVSAMRSTFYYDDGTKMAEVGRLVLAALSMVDLNHHQNCIICSSHNNGRYPTHPGSKNRRDHHSFYSASFHAEWDLLGFLKSQFDDHVPQLGSLVVLSGSAFYAQATTCSDYLQSTWPQSGAFFLSTLQSAVESSPITGIQRKTSRAIDSNDNLDLEIQIFDADFSSDAHASNVSIFAYGTSQMLVELAQQLAWIGAALSSSPFGEKFAYSEAIITKTISECPKFDMKFLFEPLHPAESACWLPIFLCASIARGFPIAKRQNEMGLEIPVDIMARIIGARHAVEFDGGVIIKGFSSMLVPIRRYEDRVQWHLISSPNCETRLPYQEVLSRCPNRATLNEVNLESLRTTRAIVGWCSAATSLLGSSVTNYENMDYSGAENASTPLKCAGGTFGFQQLGIAQFDLTLGPKDGKCHFQRIGPYERIISAAEKSPVVLYDKAEKRAWLVPASGVMLHIAHHRNWSEPFKVDGKQIKLCTVSPRGPSTKEVLLKSASTSLSDYELYSYRDMIINIWSILEFLIEQNVQRDRTAGTTIKCSLQDVIQGFEFKAITEERSPIRLKQSIIQKTSGGWPALVRDIDALVLFANGYEDIIKPLVGGNEGLCHLWQSVPKWKDYLATSVRTLNDLYNVAGSRLDRMYLTSTHLQWHRGNSSLFEPCITPGAYHCHCERLQQIIPKFSAGQVIAPGHLPEDGAVIFGRSKNWFQDFAAAAAQLQKKCSGIYSQPNVSLMPRQDPDEILPSIHSDTEPSLRSGSDAADCTPTSSMTSDLSPCTIQKECWSPDNEAVQNQKGPRRDIFIPTPKIRTGSGDDSMDEDVVDLHHEALRSSAPCMKTYPLSSQLDDTIGYITATQMQPLHEDSSPQTGNWRHRSAKKRASLSNGLIAISQGSEFVDADTNISNRLPPKSEVVTRDSRDDGEGKFTAGGMNTEAVGTKLGRPITPMRIILARQIKRQEKDLYKE